ncbi:MAG: DUF3592 domain-containing protein [Candidatus Hodarchaeales archaeon]|jgi:hypothetical protein
MSEIKSRLARCPTILRPFIIIIIPFLLIIFLVNFFLIISLYIINKTFKHLKTIKDQSSSRSWSTTEGTITSWSIKEGKLDEDYDTIVYVPVIEYSYFVLDKQYRSEHIRLFKQPSYFSELEAKKMIDTRYPVGKKVPVYYNPKKPDQTVLEPGIKDSGGESNEMIVNVIWSLCCFGPQALLLMFAQIFIWGGVLTLIEILLTP